MDFCVTCGAAPGLPSKNEAISIYEGMNITLPPEQEAWLRAHVATGDDASVEAAARQIIADRMAESALDDDEMAWAKPSVEEARAAIVRGEVMSIEEHGARNAARLAALRK